MNLSTFFCILTICLGMTKLGFSQNTKEKPNFIIIYVDDLRWDALGAAGNHFSKTPLLDSLVGRGAYFPNAFVTLSICSPSRAALLTGRYGSANGVMDMSSAVKKEEKTMAHYFGENGYATSVFGKWHLPNSPQSLGFQYEYFFNGIEAYWDVLFTKNGKKTPTKGFVDDVTADAALDYLQDNKEKPFFMFFNTLAPHMDKYFDWAVKPVTLKKYKQNEAPIPSTWQENFEGKPPYLKQSRPHERALFYGYDKSDSIQAHVTRYAAATTDMDNALRTFMNGISKMNLKNTYIIIMGDNGWFMGEHGLTSKVLAYEESIKVPLLILGPNIKASVQHELALNIDILPTILPMAGIKVSDKIHGQNLLPFTKNKKTKPNRKYIFYEAPHPVHGTYPHYAIRTKKWKYIATYDVNMPTKLIYEELYDLQKDEIEKINLANQKAHFSTKQDLQKYLQNELNMTSTR